MTTTVSLRPMTSAEFQDYVVVLTEDVARALSATMPADEARQRATGAAQSLPDGVDTPRHDLLVAENEAGEPVGTAWVGPDPYRPESDGRWLNDIRVHPQWRRNGYGAAILRAVEDRCRAEGAGELGLNVFGDNAPAIALYTDSGYEVVAMRMRKPLGR